MAGVLLLNLAEWFLNDLLTYSLTFPLMHWLHQEMPFEQDTWLFGSLFPGRTFWIRNLIAGLFIGVKLFREWQQKQAESQRLEREKLQTELQLLKLQLNPDFLFGSLRALHTLAQQQSKLAPEVVLKLAHFLRYVLYESQAERVLVAWEAKVIEQYVFLQRAMHPSGLEVSLTIRGNLANQTVVPLLLFPIVENAFRQLPAKQASQQPDEPAWISIDLAVGETHLTLKVIDGQAVAQTDNSKQLVDIQKQLYFHYADSYDLQLRSEPDVYIVTLMLPFVVSAASPSGQLSKSQSSADYETTLPAR
ncbi:hypothetical protein GCM10027190_27990 [Spirosoma areae]